EALERTVGAAVGRELRRTSGQPGLLAQLAHLAFPVSVGEEGVLGAAGMAAVGVSFAGEAGPQAREPVSRARLSAAGRGVLSAFYALDGGAEVSRSANANLELGERVLPGWSLRLLIGSLLLAPFALSVDALVRASRRGRSGGSWVSLALTCGLPIFAAAIVVKLLAAGGLLDAPIAPVPAEGLGISAGAVVTLALALAALAAGMLLWWRRLAAPLLARGDARSSGGAAALSVACVLAFVVWIVNPYAALLLIPALHLWPLALCPDHGPQARRGRIALALLALVPCALLLAFYAATLGLGAGSLLLSGLLLLGGGQVDWGGALLWSLAFGVLATIGLAAAVTRPRRAGDYPGGTAARRDDGPLAKSFAGPRPEPAVRLARAANRV
ncbi:MAG: hypothetical protein ACYCU0_11375, partial [Solirubrobacteraceae bacterium]